MTDQRAVELDRTVEAIERELPPLDVHQRLVLAREIDAYASRVIAEEPLLPWRRDA
jgi:hypothetical protein